MKLCCGHNSRLLKLRCGHDSRFLKLRCGHDTRLALKITLTIVTLNTLFVVL
jgi:hypothetical protein